MTEGIKPRGVGDLYGPYASIRFYAHRLLAEESQLGRNLNTAPETVDDLIFRDNNSGFFENEAKNREFQRDLDGAALHNFVSSVSIRQIGPASAYVDIQLTPPYQDAIRILDTRFIRRGVAISVRWGYFSNGEDIYEGPAIFLLTKPDINFGIDTTITIRGFGLIYANLSSADRRICWDRKQYGTDLKIIEKLASDSGLIVDSSKIPDDHSLKLTRPQKGEQASLEQIKSDWIFFRNILLSNNASYRESGNTIVLIPKKETILNPPKYRFLWFSQPKDRTDVPMINFSTKIHQSVFNPPESIAVTNIKADPDSGGVVEKTFDDATDPNSAKNGAFTEAGRRAARKKIIKLENSFVRTGGFTDGTLVNTSIFKHNNDEWVRQLSQNAAGLVNTLAEVTAPGVPDIKPYDNIMVQGVSESLSGVYYVLEVTHNINSDGYTMQIKCLKNSSKQKSTSNTPTASPKNRFTDKVEVEAVPIDDDPGGSRIQPSGPGPGAAGGFVF